MAPKAKVEVACQGVTKTGQPCKLAAKEESGLCWRHSKENEGTGGEAEPVILHSPNKAEPETKTDSSSSVPSTQQETNQQQQPAQFSFGCSTSGSSLDVNSQSAFTGLATTPTPTESTETTPKFQFDFTGTQSFNSSPSTTTTTTTSISTQLSGSGTPTFKVVIVGDGGVGKTAFVEKWLKGDFSTQYVPTLGTQRNTLSLRTSLEASPNVNLDLWDVAGQEKFGGLRDGYFIGAHAAIICFDVTSKMSYNNIPSWYRDIARVCDLVPIVLVGLKADVGSQRQYELSGDSKGGQGPSDSVPIRTVMPSQIVFHRKKNLPYYDVSTKSLLNIGKPFTYLLQRLTGYANLSIEHPLLAGRPSGAEDEGDEEAKTPKSVAGALPFGAGGGETSDIANPFGHLSVAAPAASTPSFHLSGALHKDAQPSPFEARFGNNSTGLSFQLDPAPSPEPSLSFTFAQQKPLDFNSPFAQPSFAPSPSTFSFGSSSTTTTTTTFASSAFSPFAGNPSADGKTDGVADLASQFGSPTFSLGRSPAPATQDKTASEKKAQKPTTFLEQEFEDEDEEADPDYDPALDADEGDEGDEGDYYEGDDYDI